MPVRRFMLLIAVSCLSACGPVPDPRSSAPVDLHPPVVQSVCSTGSTEIVVELDEEASIAADKVRITPALAVTATEASGNRITVCSDAQAPGVSYQMEAEATDRSGNVASFMAEFYGYNPRVPRLLLNELTPRGTTDHPDLLEIKVISAGDMGGVVLYQGTPGSFDDRVVFPSFAVGAGSFIVVHWKPSGSPAEVNETSDVSASGGTDASPTGYDFWVAGGQGLGGNNGVLSLYERPGGKLMDGLLYSNRTSTSDEKYLGFGSAAMLARAQELVKDGGWRAAGVRVTPEDAVSPEGSTSTRSLCRSSTGADADAAADWHIVPTRKSSFGAENSDEVYVP
ncbi:MAG TPA: hypothetical protein VMV03_04060 [Spirochaetia bacterium]|nr:hypothetical protein [Spirochaetia bacterium]